ncbi:MAG: hypothetical protein ACYDCT_03050 [Dehalococcoidia bacterium]
MLILDKRRAVEHMVALTAQHAEPEPEEPQAARRGRHRRKIATFERRAGAAASSTGAQRPAAARGAAARPAGGVSMA